MLVHACSHWGCEKAMQGGLRGGGGGGGGGLGSGGGEGWKSHGQLGVKQ